MQDDLAEKLFDNQAVVVVEPIADYRHCLYQSELELVKDAIDKRMLEFSTGRDCAHQALHQLGYETCPILKGPEREPLWPDQIIGSISHCRDLAGAVVADKQNMRSIGLDIENIKQLNPGIARHVCTEHEKNWLMQQDITQQNLALLLIFSLKEAVFKCIYQATGHSLHFRDCQILPDFSEKKVTIDIYKTEYKSADTSLQGFFSISKSHIYTGVTWR